jgi:sterol desaturase/sphingolipid hydroxylase (fatty acid hydroxylase superfamily)
LGIILGRYFFIAGGTYWLFYGLLGKFLAHRSLRSETSSTTKDISALSKSIYRDIKMSILSGVIFALGAALIMTEYDQEKTLLYGDLEHYGFWYLGISFLAVLILQDGYFYFLHRLFHHPLLFKWIHSGHHRSVVPTPWTSFAFDLPEAFIQALFFCCIVFIIPLHFLTLISLLVTMTISSVWTHLGLEIFPSSFSSHWLGKWLIGSTNHAVHHRRHTVNYGLYFTFWDKYCGTQDSIYHQ